MTLKVSILGSGAWGTALACVSARAGHETVIWGRSVEQVKDINSNHQNKKYLGDLNLEPKVRATTELSKALADADLILLCVPTQTLEETLDKIEPYMNDAELVSCCKGIDRQTGKLATDLVKTHFPEALVGTLSGPGFAKDVVRDMPTAVTVASKDRIFADKISASLSSANFRCYATQDVKGVELGGALKNVLALAVGATRGMELGASAEAALVARGFAEISRIAVTLGANLETLSGLSGIGDIVLTCSSAQSRNFTFGVAMGRGDSFEGLPLAEGAYTASIALKIAKENNVDAPIIEAVVNVLENKVTAKEAVANLLTRPLKREN